MLSTNSPSSCGNLNSPPHTVCAEPVDKNPISMQTEQFIKIDSIHQQLETDQQTNIISQSSPKTGDNIDASSARSAPEISTNLETSFQLPSFLTTKIQHFTKNNNERSNKGKRTILWQQDSSSKRHLSTERVQPEMTLYTDTLQKQEKKILSIIAEVERKPNKEIKQFKTWSEWKHQDKTLLRTSTKMLI